jgi:hypothetical protein
MRTVCHFRAGDEVIYRPSQKGFDSDAMIGQLTPGNRYRIEAIQKEVYVLVENYTHLSGGIYWTEFKLLD